MPANVGDRGTHIYVPAPLAAYENGARRGQAAPTNSMAVRLGGYDISNKLPAIAEAMPNMMAR
jgi:hypothetical protein